jgi:hypothetical protein
MCTYARTKSRTPGSNDSVVAGNKQNAKEKVRMSAILLVHNLKENFIENFIFSHHRTLFQDLILSYAIAASTIQVSQSIVSSLPIVRN